jgi:methionine-rich copper-binding protein CopC
MLRKLLHMSLAVAGMATSSCAPSLAARPYLVAAWPPAGSSLSVNRQTFELTFNRPLRPELSTAAVWREEEDVPTPTEVRLEPADSTRLRVRLVEPAAGAYQLHWHAVAAESGAAVDGDQAFRLQDESPAPPRIEVSPAKADKGETLELVGKGFAKHSVVQLTIADDQQSLASVETDGAGKFSAEAKVPPSVPFGVQPVSATDGLGRNALGAVAVRWGGWPPVVATSVGQPGPGLGEVTFTVNVRNGSDYLVEHVRVVLKDPESGVLVGADPAPQRDAATLVWMIPVMDRGLVGPFRATYRTNAPAVGKAWLEFRHRHVGPCVDDDCLPAFISDSSADSPPVAPAE